MVHANNTHGERVRITSTRHNKSKLIAYDYKLDNALEVAKEYLSKELKYTIKATCELTSWGQQAVLVKEFSEFKPSERVFDDNGKRLY